MSETRCSNSHVVLCDGQELFCENTPEDILQQLEATGKVKLDITNPATELTVASNFIVRYSYAD